jgi:hypothetical protein
VPRWNLYEVERHVYQEVDVVYEGRKKYLRGIIEESENGKEALEILLFHEQK